MDSVVVYRRSVRDRLASPGALYMLMNSNQKRALKVGAAVAILVCILYPWTGETISLSIPTNFEPLIGWGIMDARIDCNLIQLALPLIVVATGISLIMLRSRRNPDGPSDNGPPIPRP